MPHDLHWRLIFGLGFLAFFLLRWRYAAKAKKEAIALSRVDLQERLLLGLMFICWMALPFLWLWTPLFAFADYAMPQWLRLLGVAFEIAAVWLFWRSHEDLGRQWSISLELRNGHRIVDQGVYRRIRHPMYAAIWLWGISQALLIPNFIVGPSVLFAFFWMYLLRTPREEQMLLEQFGDAYADYMKRTGRILPRFS